ncbi:MAG: hypothetical protein ABR507_03875 [Actinomycetota bacterium]|nr:hypothetical protein [Actinomycetota bacterium]
MIRSVSILIGIGLVVLGTWSGSGSAEPTPMALIGAGLIVAGLLGLGANARPGSPRSGNEREG